MDSFISLFKPQWLNNLTDLWWNSVNCLAPIYIHVFVFSFYSNKASCSFGNVHYTFRCKMCLLFLLYAYVLLFIWCVFFFELPSLDRGEVRFSVRYGWFKRKRLKKLLKYVYSCLLSRESKTDVVFGTRQLIRFVNLPLGWKKSLRGYEDRP